MSAAADAHLGMIITCDRCQRTVHPWPSLRRPDDCAPAHWESCIRQPYEGLTVRDGFTARPIFPKGDT